MGANPFLARPALGLSRGASGQSGEEHAAEVLLGLQAWGNGLGSWLAAFLCVRQVRRAHQEQLTEGLWMDDTTASLENDACIPLI